MKDKKRFTVRIGPVALSLVAAVLTAVAFAAISVADSGSSGGGKDVRTFRGPAPPGGPGVMFRGSLSDQDKQKLEDFRTCMQDNGAPGPPDPSKIDPSDGPPKPPSKADREKVQKAYEACKDKLPEDMQKAGPPQFHTFKCGPPPGQPGQEKGRNQSQSNDSGTSSSGSSS